MIPTFQNITDVSPKSTQGWPAASASSESCPYPDRSGYWNSSSPPLPCHVLSLCFSATCSCFLGSKLRPQKSMVIWCRSHTWFYCRSIYISSTIGAPYMLFRVCSACTCNECSLFKEPFFSLVLFPSNFIFHGTGGWRVELGALNVLSKYSTTGLYDQCFKKVFEMVLVCCLGCSWTWDLSLLRAGSTVG